MSNFTKAGYIKRRKMPIEELVKYYAQQRKAEWEKGGKLKGISLRKRLHFLVNLILKIDRIASHEKVVVICDRHKKKFNTPTVYACTHIGGNDIQRTFQVIGAPAYLMLGDPGILYRKPIYWGLRLNGVIPLETDDREDRKIAYTRAVELLQNGGNLLIYPEGAWNVSLNLVVMKTFTGTVRMVRETGAEIVPIAMEQYGDTFYFNIGEGYHISKDSNKSANDWNEDLRSRLATLKWEIMERQASLQRKEIPRNYLNVFQSEIVNRCNFGYGFSLEDALREAFHDKHIHTAEEVFSHMSSLIPSKENAFLLRNWRI